MKKCNRFLALALAVVMMFTLLPQSSLAAEAKTYLALGDSISTGYGLSDVDNQAFPVLLTEVLGEEYCLVNKAVNGETTRSLLARLESPEYQQAVQAADLITVTIGGNDLMDLLYSFLENAMGIPAKELEASFAAGDLPVISAAAELINAGGFAPGQEDYSAIGASFLQAISRIRALNPYAALVVTTQYDPYEKLAEQLSSLSNTPFFPAEYKPLADAVIRLSATIDTALAALNSGIQAGTQKLDYHVADISSVFTQSTENLSNAALAVFPAVSVNLDFHPNSAGHQAIAGCMQMLLSQVHIHSFLWKVDKEPTETEAGLKHEECDCGLKRNVETQIPATGIPSTGDNVDLAFWFTLVCVSGLAVAACAFMKQRKK